MKKRLNVIYGALQLELHIDCMFEYPKYQSITCGAISSKSLLFSVVVYFSYLFYFVLFCSITQGFSLIFQIQCKANHLSNFDSAFEEVKPLPIPIVQEEVSFICKAYATGIGVLTNLATRILAFYFSNILSKYGSVVIH